MTLEKRHNALIEFLFKHGYASVIKLSEEFSVSEMTIRRDLAELEERGLIKRTYGGAKPNETRFHELSWKVKINQYVEEKKRIGQAAAELVSNEDTIILDTGSTTFQLIPHFGDKSLTVITNGLSAAVELANNPQIRTFVVGGMMRNGPLSLVGPQAETFLQGLSVDKLFMGVDGIDVDAGFTVPDLFDAYTKKAMMRCAEQVIVVADHSKLGNRVLAPVAALSEADLIITDNGASEEALSRLREHIEVLVV